MSSYQSAKVEVERLVEKFSRDYQRFINPNYNEEQVRVEFITPFFRALGWDVENSLQVIHEDRVIVDEAGEKRVKHPDYGFRTGRDIRFYVEAKKPAVNLKNNSDPAYQIRRYGWSRGLPLSVLTDFEEFIIYNCLEKPSPSDKPHIARLRDNITYDKYLDVWDELYSVFSYEAVLDGALERYVDDNKPKGTVTVDTAFLQELEHWRELLAKDIALRNPRLTRRQLNIAVQRTIDRLVFLRITEDRNIEPYGRLNRIAKNRDDVYDGLKRLYAEANDKYNSGLFHFTDDDNDEVGDPVSLKIEISGDTLQSIITKLYYPYSPYEFSVLPSDILGQVYERFLGSVIVLDGGSATIEEKPEVRKAGGVFYTPTYIVDYIVENTVGKLVENKNPNQVAELRILDPACGSGSFLIGAYQYLLDWHLNHYLERIQEKPTSNFKSRIRETDDPSQPYVLTTDEKKRILLNNIYGVDLDQQAVEVSKLSLLLKMLENETASSTTQYAMFGTDEHLLPDLADNIKWGNSLIGRDFYSGKQIPMFDEEEIYRVKAFDWESNEGFGEIMRSGGFDAVIGNPPYGASINNIENEYFVAKYESQSYQLDTYLLFLENMPSLMKRETYLGFIIPNTWLLNLLTPKIRAFIFNNLAVVAVVHYLNKVFKDATVDTQTVVLKKDDISKNHQVKIEVVEKDGSSETHYIPQSIWIDKNGEPVNIFEKPEVTNVIHNTEHLPRLIDVCSITQGTKPFQTGKGIPKQTKEIVKEKPFVSEQKENETFRPLIRGSLMNRYKIMWNNNYYISYGDWLAEPRYSANFDATEKIIIRQTGYDLRATLDKEQFIARDNLYVIHIKDSYADYDLRYILGLLNCQFFSWYYQNAINPEKGEALAQVKKGHLAKLPIHTMDFDNPDDKAQHDKIVQQVETMLDLHKQLPEVLGAQKRLIEQQIVRTDREIDTLVYELYGLTSEEIAIVEEASK